MKYFEIVDIFEDLDNILLEFSNNELSSKDNWESFQLTQERIDNSYLDCISTVKKLLKHIVFTEREKVAELFDLESVNEQEYINKRVHELTKAELLNLIQLKNNPSKEIKMLKYCLDNCFFVKLEDKQLRNIPKYSKYDTFTIGLFRYKNYHIVFESLVEQCNVDEHVYLINKEDIDKSVLFVNHVYNLETKELENI